jgi:uncharacterized tellurite resistance protein B-like protein
MSDDFLGDRRKALEEAFFAKQNAAQLDRLRADRERAAAVEELERMSGIDDPALLAKLVDLGLGPASWTALSLVPLVEVAWADGSVKEREREAILSAAAEAGIGVGSPGYALLESWLDRRPEPSLFASWAGYTVELAAQLDGRERVALRDDLIARARRVARAAGGLLGIGTVSEAEKRVIAKVGEPFA